MKKIIALLLIAFTCNAFGQDDDVEKTRALTFHIDPIYTEAYGTNTSVGIGWRTEIMFKRFLSLDLKFRSARYSDQLLKTYNADKSVMATIMANSKSSIIITKTNNIS